MRITHSVDLTFFGQKQQALQLLYNLYVDYVRTQSAKGNYEIPSKFVLVSAFASVHNELEVVAGWAGFISDIDHQTRRVQYEMPEHYWLTWQNPDYIIDLLPCDGEFGISVPQAIIQRDGLKRFFPSKNLYPRSWGKERMIQFDNDVSDLVADLTLILEGLQKKVPL